MSMARIEIEQIEGTRWVGELEIGGLIARRETFRDETFRGLLLQVTDAYARLMAPPQEKPPPIEAVSEPPPAEPEDEEAEEEAIAVEETPRHTTHRRLGRPRRHA